MNAGTPEPTLEAVYYEGPMPRDLGILTSLAIVFDRLHFPNVNLPEDGYDVEATAAEATRIESLRLREGGGALLVGLLRMLPHLKYLKEFCTFAGTPDQAFEGDSEEVKQLAAALEREIYGPPPPGFIPVFHTGFSKGLPGGNVSINYPGSIHYPAIALTYAAKHGLPLVNANPGLPVPGFAGGDAKHNAKLLSTFLAMECVDFALPVGRPLSPVEIVRLRHELQPYLQPFRSNVAKLAKELNEVIGAGEDLAEVQRAARSLVETDVAPTMAELRAAMSKPAHGWMMRGFEAVKQVPSIAATYSMLGAAAAVAQALAAIGGLLTDLNDKDPKKAAAKSGLYYLLRLQDLNARRQ